MPAKFSPKFSPADLQLAFDIDLFHFDAPAIHNREIVNSITGPVRAAFDRHNGGH